MKKTYTEPNIQVFYFGGVDNIICTSTLEVMDSSYEEGNMTDLSRSSRFSTWEELEFAE